MATAPIKGTRWRNRTMSASMGSGTGSRSTTSYQAQQAWLKHHMAMPEVTRLQNRRVWPWLSIAFLPDTNTAAASTNKGSKSPTTTRKKGFGNTTGATAKASRRPTPQKDAEMWERDATLTIL